MNYGSLGSTQTPSDQGVRTRDRRVENLKSDMQTAWRFNVGLWAVMAAAGVGIWIWARRDRKKRG